MEKVFGLFGHNYEELGIHDENNHTAKWIKISIRSIIHLLTKKYDEKTLLCGWNMGSELWFLEEALAYRNRSEDNKITVKSILPFPEVTGRNTEGNVVSKTFWPIENHNRLTASLSSVDDVKILTNKFSTEQRIKNRNEWVMDNSTGIVCVMNRSCKKGPTYDVVSYAARKRLPACIIDPEKETIYVY